MKKGRKQLDLNVGSIKIEKKHKNVWIIYMHTKISRNAKYYLFHHLFKIFQN